MIQLYLYKREETLLNLLFKSKIHKAFTKDQQTKVVIQVSVKEQLIELEVQINIIGKSVRYPRLLIIRKI
jgi:hypothetical protein